MAAPRFPEPSIPYAEQTSVARAKIGAAVERRLAATPGVQRIANDHAVLFFQDDFLKPSECTVMMRLIDLGCVPSKLFEGDAYDGFRTSRSCDLDRNDRAVAAVDARIALTLGIQPRFSETVQGQRYEPGQRFGAHPDYFFIDQPYWPDLEKRGGQRTWTAMVYLNVPEAGGDTAFPFLGFAVRPRAGMLLAWNNMAADGAPNPWTFHEGTPVTAGRKYVVTKWFRERPWL